MPQQSDLVDEAWLLGTFQTLVNFLALVVINHVLLQMSLVAKDFPAKRASDLGDDMSVAKVILENTFRWVIFIADVT